eukprot:TRINITY_DN40_c0_g1_i15.p1 TRINITY_DN40_c0_g1~~TRINITY_DN40_c0_g1_i15.p1  ORF type:complete len:268 (+),score=63.93 TRINITY_DN40_c0_g1_i15:195-998(+)
MISRGRTEPTNHIARTDLVTRVQSLGALACTSKAVFRGPFVPALMKVTHVPRNDIATLKSVMDGAASSGEPIAGVIMEPVMGEGGIFVLEPEYLQAARDLCDEHDSMLIFDEVQSGMGRTGKWFACEWAGVSPDLMALAKGLGGGVQPVGACLGSERVWGAYIDNPFIHTTTFGGNPLAMAAAIATMFVIHSENLCDAYYSLSPFTCYLSPFTCYLSPFTCSLSPFTCFAFASLAAPCCTVALCSPLCCVHPTAHNPLPSPFFVTRH